MDTRLGHRCRLSRASLKLRAANCWTGGIADSIPVKYFQSIGYDRNVVVLTQPKGYRKGKNSIRPLIRRKYKRYPNLVTAMENRPAMYNETLDYIAQEETAGRLLVIRPPRRCRWTG